MNKVLLLVQLVEINVHNAKVKLITAQSAKVIEGLDLDHNKFHIVVVKMENLMMASVYFVKVISFIS